MIYFLGAGFDYFSGFSCMRFGKRLALAMLRDAGEAPYLSQKELKHILVGLEKLCKAYSDQLSMLQSEGISKAAVVVFANAERDKYGLPYQESLLDLSEVVSRDEALFRTLDDDVRRIRQYLDKCEADLMEAINEFLVSAASKGFIVGPDDSWVARDKVKYSQFLLSEVGAAEPDPDLIGELDAIENEMQRLKQYLDVNASAVRKIVSRRNKNVPECFWFLHDFNKVSPSPESIQIFTAVQTLRTAIS